MKKETKEWALSIYRDIKFFKKIDSVEAIENHFKDEMVEDLSLVRSEFLGDGSFYDHGKNAPTLNKKYFNKKVAREKEKLKTIMNKKVQEAKGLFELFIQGHLDEKLESLLGELSKQGLSQDNFIRYAETGIL